MTTPSSSVAHFFGSKISKERTAQVDIKLVKALVYSNVALSFVENPYFREFCSALNTDYCLPGRSKVSETTLHSIYTSTILELTDELKDARDITIILDGWTDVSRNSVYAFMAVTREKQYILDIRHFKDRPTASNILDATKDVLE